MIEGYNAGQIAQMNAKRARTLQNLFGHPVPSDPVVFCALDDEGELVGGAVIEMPDIDEIAAAEPERAKEYSITHAMLAALFVLPEHRKRGIGAQLLDVAGAAALQRRARWLDGFVDARNNSASFYSAAGAEVMPINTGLPPRQPMQVTVGHPPWLNGNWFYVDLWQSHGHLMRCERHGTALEFDPGDGGYLRCDECGIPRSS